MVPIGLECEVEITEEGGAFIARCSSPDIASDGKTGVEALANLREAIALYFESTSSPAGGDGNGV